MSTQIEARTRREVRRKVLIALYWWEDRVFEGVAQVAAEHGWILDCRMRWRHMIPELASWQGDGIIANPGLSRPIEPLIDLIGRSEIPTVGLQGFGEYPSTVRVVLDHGAIGRMAAEHFLSLGFERIGYVLFADNPIEHARCDGFAGAVEAAGARFFRIPIAELRERLAAESMPVGLWALNDLNAIDVTTACLDAGFRVPEEVAVLGTDDSRTLCDFSEVPLSSVRCNFEEQGRVAAEILHRLMEGEALESESLVIEPAGVTSRRSTDTIAIPDLAAIEALRFIRDRFEEPLTVEQVAREVGVSLRRLQDSFRKHLGFTMAHEIARVRVEHARTLLADPQLKLDAVALESGFSSRFHFIRAFQRIMGETPTAYRKRGSSGSA